MTLFRQPRLQLVNPQTLLLMYRENYVHLTGRDGVPSEDAAEHAVTVIDLLEDLSETVKGQHSLDERVRVHLMGLWFDCKSPDMQVYLVTEPTQNSAHLGKDTVQRSIYQRILIQSRKALQLLLKLEEEREISGFLAEFFHTGSIDYHHPILKFFGKDGFYRGLARFDGDRLADFGDISDSFLSHPPGVIVPESERVHSYEDARGLAKRTFHTHVPDTFGGELLTREGLKDLIDEVNRR